MILTTADADPFIPANNLSTACKHYRTCTNLCSTVKSTLETYCNLSTATDLQQLAFKLKDRCCHNNEYSSK
ncbi:MAG TPA: hypothetical protein VHT34_10805 [Clostridia bacterium]|nr:hypothetical protein [Clostridia bacterium]